MFTLATILFGCLFMISPWLLVTEGCYCSPMISNEDKYCNSVFTVKAKIIQKYIYNAAGHKYYGDYGFDLHVYNYYKGYHSGALTVNTVATTCGYHSLAVGTTHIMTIYINYSDYNRYEIHRCQSYVVPYSSSAHNLVNGWSCNNPTPNPKPKPEIKDV